MKTLAVVTLLAFALLFASSARADSFDGNALLDQCEIAVNPPESMTEIDSLKMGMCLGLMNGITNLNAVYEGKMGKEAVFCSPKQGISNGQAARIVLKYLKDNPAQLHNLGSVLAIVAMREAFPCDGA